MKKNLSKVIIQILLISFVFLALGPILWAVVTSFLPLSSLTAKPIDLDPTKFTLRNYFEVLDTSQGLLSGLINSMIIASFTAGVALAVGSAAAYALARLNLPGSNAILLAILATQMFPGIVIAIPLFIVMSRLGMIDTHFGLMFVYLSFVLPIVIWILKGFFETIPIQLEKAAAIDGATNTQIFRFIILPISLPPLFATGVFAFIEAWNEFFFAIILTRINVKTAPIAISEFAGQYRTLYGQMLASAVLASLPVVILAIIFRRFILEGFVEGAVKT
jgi:multiple sugar transport system permease protein